MRLWSLHPGYLDARGLVALWHEGLLTQKVLGGTTRGYLITHNSSVFKLIPTPSWARSEHTCWPCLKRRD